MKPRTKLRDLLKNLHFTIDLRIRGERARRRRLANKLADQILGELNRSFSRTAGSARAKKRRFRLRFEYPLLLTPDELWCPLDTKSLPPGVFTSRLAEEDVLRGLCDHTRHEVRIDYLATKKFCFVVRMAGHKFPTVYGINQVEIPPDAPPLAVPLGCDGEASQIIVDLAELKHLLIAGATGGGKTTLLNAMLATLIARNTPDDLELWLIDLKRTEFNLYRPLMGGRKGNGIVRHLAVEPGEAVEVLDLAFKEIIRRNSLMEASNVTNHRDLARITGTRLPVILLAIDEFAILSTDTTKTGKQSIGGASTLLMTRIAALGRSAGVHIVVATQMVNREVLSSMIRANFENRIAFSTADWRQSQLVVESSEADGLPLGRAIFRHEGRTSELQTCLITPRQVKLEVARIAEFGPDGNGDDQEMVRFVRDARLIIDAACKHFNGVMSRNKMLALEGIRGVITTNRFDEVAARLERDGIVSPGRPKHGRAVQKAFFNRSALLETMYLGGGKSTTEMHGGSSQVGEGDWTITDTDAQPTVVDGEVIQDSIDPAVSVHDFREEVKKFPLLLEDEPS